MLKSRLGDHILAPLVLGERDSRGRICCVTFYGSFRPECGANRLATQSNLLMFGVRGSGFGVRDFALFWDYRLAKTRIPSPEFRIPIAVQIGLCVKKTSTTTQNLKEPFNFNYIEENNNNILVLKLS